MKTSATLRSLVVALVAGLAFAGISYAGPAAPSVPGDIAVEAGNKVFLVGHASGVQIYACNGTAWSTATPRAELRGDNGKVIAKHYGGPTWEARDGSKVVGARVNGVPGASGRSRGCCSGPRRRRPGRRAVA